MKKMVKSLSTRTRLVVLTVIGVSVPLSYAIASRPVFAQTIVNPDSATEQNESASIQDSESRVRGEVATEPAEETAEGTARQMWEVNNTAEATWPYRTGPSSV